MRAMLVALVLSFGGDAAVGMTDAAMRAAEEKRYCDAAFIFLQVYAKTRSDLALYSAAEVAWAADDRQLALRLYRSLLENHPDAAKRPIAEERVVKLKALMQETGGTGTACVQPPPTCGDWIVAPGEACDDGNVRDGDGCDANCKATGCGNGLRSVGEDCDDGNLRDGDGCDSNCSESACGNGVKAPNEQCDDGNLIDGDTCTSTCALPPAESFTPSPWPTVTTVSGVAVIVGGGIASGVASIPILAHEEAVVEIQRAEDEIQQDPARALAVARAAQVRQQRATADWNAWGQPLMIAGLAAASAGAVVTGLGVFLIATEEP